MHLRIPARTVQIGRADQSAWKSPGECQEGPRDDRLVRLTRLDTRLCADLTDYRMQPGGVDLLVLPEMALSGYVFNSPSSILPYLEQPRIGPTSLLARDLATRLKCHVVAGYPEAANTDPATGDEQHPVNVEKEHTGSSGSRPRVGSLSAADAGPSSMKELEGEALGVGYNSAILVAPSGEVLGNYRKTFLFETDKNWARPGEYHGPVHGRPANSQATGSCTLTCLSRSVVSHSVSAWVGGVTGTASQC